ALIRSVRSARSAPHGWMHPWLVSSPLPPLLSLVPLGRGSSCDDCTSFAQLFEGAGEVRVEHTQGRRRLLDPRRQLEVMRGGLAHLLDALLDVRQALPLPRRRGDDLLAVAGGLGDHGGEVGQGAAGG